MGVITFTIELHDEEDADNLVAALKRLHSEGAEWFFAQECDCTHD